MQTTPGTSLSEPPSAGPTSRRSTLAVAAVVTVAVYILDQVTKAWAVRALANGQPRQLLGSFLELQLTHNAGAAFSFGTGYTVVLTLVALAVIVGCLRVSRRLGSLGWAVALGLLLAGALGNVTDRLFRSPAPFRGHVVDFIELPHWPVFNVADSAICVAAALIVVLTLRGVHLDGSRSA